MCLPQMLRTVQHRAEVIPAGRVDTPEQGPASKQTTHVHAMLAAKQCVPMPPLPAKSTNAPRALGIPSRLAKQDPVMFQQCIWADVDRPGMWGS